MGLKTGSYDGHAHVFRADLSMASPTRYTPGYHASLADYMDLLRSNELDGGLLVQPSFLGTDNSFLLTSLEEAREVSDLTFRGVVVLSPDTPDREFDRLNDCGIVGARLNLKGVSKLFDVTEWASFLRKVDQRGWHVELHCEGENLAHIVPALLARCGSVVVDHFGLVGSELSDSNAGLATLLKAPTDQLFVKVSAPYRAFTNVSTYERLNLSSVVFQRLIDHLGPSHLIWGSDWPWTQFEGAHSYETTRNWLESWLANSR